MFTTNRMAANTYKIFYVENLLKKLEQQYQLTIYIPESFKFLLATVDSLF